VLFSNIYTSFEKVFGIKSFGLMCEFRSGSQFIVHKNNILNKSREFYENIVNMLSYDIDPKEGHDIKLFHKYIFLYKFT